jgi:hypothetical protein
MLFASKASNLQVEFPGRQKIRKIADANGNLQEIVDCPPLMCVFRARAMTETQRVIADRMFRAINPDYPYGAVPYAVGDAMGSEFSTEDVMPGSRYVGFDPRWNIGKFDTRVDLDYQAQGCFTDEEKSALKKQVDAYLSSHPMLNQEFVRLDESLPKPWPSYPLETGPGVAQKIVAQARDFGVSWVEVIEYEKSQDEPRKGVLSMLEAEIAKEQEAVAEDAALSAVIPS